MDSLVVCTCGHGLVAHESPGCTARGCACRDSYGGVLDAVVESVRRSRKIRARRKGKEHA